MARKGLVGGQNMYVAEITHSFMSVSNQLLQGQDNQSAASTVANPVAGCSGIGTLSGPGSTSSTGLNETMASIHADIGGLGAAVQDLQANVVTTAVSSRNCC